MMRGWKTWLGVGLIVLSAWLRSIGKEELANTVISLGIASGLVGIGHKLEKSRKDK